MRNTQVVVYGRAKPCPQSLLSRDIDIRIGRCNGVHWKDEMPKAPRIEKCLKFKKIFDANSTQEQVFETVANPIIKDVLSGYNGLIFTYGQSGTGKTHTISGDAMEPKYQGLISRTIRRIFQLTLNPVAKVTYCEIYNERVRDLIGDLDAEPDGTKVSQFKSSKITMFRDLTVHRVGSAADALELFIRGNEKKTTAETEDGGVASRSHVIFSIRLELPCTEDGILHLNPILYLVDFANNAENREGSSSNPLEARNMNLSLLCLEHVLLTLRQPRKGCLPYRNSRMTGFLKTTLGGNFITAVIATFSLSKNDIEQTIQTCQFAERLAQVTVLAYPNEVIIPSRKIFNPSKDIELLEMQYKFLKAHLGIFLNDQLPEEDLDDDEKIICADLVEKFIAGNDAVELLDADIRKIIFCFHLMREAILKKEVSQENPIELQSSDLSFTSNNELQVESSKDSEFKLNEESCEKKSSVELINVNAPKENISKQGIENKPSGKVTVNENSKSDLKSCDAVPQNPDNLVQKCNEEYVLVQKKIADRSELVLCMVKSVGNDILSNQAKSSPPLKM